MKASCPRLRFKTIKHEAQPVRARRIEAHMVGAARGRSLLGAITVTQVGDSRPPRVTHIDVDETWRRCGIGTRLYEHAAKVACSVFKQPLHSDTERSKAADGFWQKQVKKGRAICLETTDYVESYDDEIPIHSRSGCVRYALTKCPAPASLAGRRK